MEAKFWYGTHGRSKDIRFHEAATNPLLVRNLPAAEALAGGGSGVCSSVREEPGYALPARAVGICVVGAELSVLWLCGSCLHELEDGAAGGERAGALERYEAGALTVYVGDLFELDAATLGRGGCGV